MDDDDDEEQDSVDPERSLRISIWEQTHALVMATSQLNPSACQEATVKFEHPPRELSTPLSVPDGTTMKATAVTSFYQRMTISQRDCVHAALDLATSDGPPPILMDAGSRGHFGGGYENGARAQEEELCRRSNLAHCVDPQHGQTTVFHPLPPMACIYVPSVQFFRDGADANYALYMQEDQCTVQSTTLAVGIVAATRNPVLVSGSLRGDIAENTQEAIANFLHCARAHGHKHVVLVPLGCGAYRNPPGQVAKLFEAALLETLPDGGKLGEAFDRIVFAVLDFPMGQPPRMTNNFYIFAHFFGSRGANVVDCNGCPVDYLSLQQ